MALDKLLQLIPGASVAAGDTISERTRKGIVEGVKLMYLPDISTADGNQSGFVVTTGKLLIGELVYDFPGLTPGSAGLVASVAGGLSLSTVTGVQAVSDAVTSGAISTAAPADVWAVTPAPMYKVDPFSVIQLTATGSVRTNPLVVDIVVNPGHKVNKLRIEYIKHDTNPANQMIRVNGKSFSAFGNTVTAVDATLGLNLTIALASGRDATYEGDVTEAVVRDGVIHGLNASSPTGVSLSKQIAFGLSNTPRGDSFTTKGMVIAGQRVEFRDKSIYLGRITGNTTVDTSQAEVFQPYPR
jgi:hypothetical protein